MEDYNKIIESLGVRFLKSKNIQILQTVTIENFYDVENTIILLNKGEVSYGKERTKVKEGDILFIPGGKLVSITYGSGPAVKLTNEEFVTNKEKYFKATSSNDDVNENFSYVAFDAKVFDSVNFFASLDVPTFVMHDCPIIAALIQETAKEESNKDFPGKDRVIKLNTERIVIEIIRYMLVNRMFVEQMATNSTYFKDPRLIDIFGYIKRELGGDLSNKVLANVANVSEDYVGQYFKMLTGINPQDYIEYQRMEQAVNLLRTSKKSIREIGREVGYKDTAYFCRRFKMMFGIPAGKMRRRESLMNV